MGIKDRNIPRSSTFFFCPFQYCSLKQNDHSRVFSCILAISSDSFLLFAIKEHFLSRTSNPYYLLSVVHLCGKKGHGLAEIKWADPVIFFSFTFLCFTIYLGLETFLEDVILPKWSLCQKKKGKARKNV